MKWLYSIVLIFFGAQHSTALGGLPISDPFQSIASAVNNFEENVGTELEGLVNADFLSSLSLENLRSLEEEKAWQLMDKVCPILASAGLTKFFITPDIGSLPVYLYTRDKKLRYNLKYAYKMINELDKNKNLTLFVTGFLQNNNEDYAAVMADAYNRQGTRNFVVLNLAEEFHNYFDLAAINAKKVGYQLSVQFLEHPHLNTNIHLIGHGAGVQVTKFAALAYIQRTGKKLERITGIDAVNHCSTGKEIDLGLESGDAVNVINFYSYLYVVGKADYNIYLEEPNLTKSGYKMFSWTQSPAYKYALASVCSDNEQGFMSKAYCFSERDLKNYNCNGNIYEFGLETEYDRDIIQPGNYLVHANENLPYFTCNKHF